MQALVRSTTRLRVSVRPCRLPVLAPIASSSSSLGWLGRADRPASPAWAGAARCASSMSSLKPNKGSRKNYKRVGRGQGSGYGGTSGRGHKGQLARRGNMPRLGFAGGQTPIMKLFPKLGKKDHSIPKYTPLNLSTLQTWIDQGRIDPTQPITMKELVDSNAVGSIKDGVLLLGRGAENLRTRNLTIVVSDASPAAIQAIEALSGTIISRFYTPKTLRALLYPHRFFAKDRFLPADAHPKRRDDWEKYADWETRRGYLGNPELSEKILKQVDERRKSMGWMTRPELAERVRKIVEARNPMQGLDAAPGPEGTSTVSAPSL